jgi:hypothetical protein
MAGSRRKEILIGGGVSLVFVLLAIVVVLRQSPDQSPTLASTAPLGSISPQVLGTVFTVPSPSPDPAESSELLPPAPPVVQTTLITSTITALSTETISGKPVVQTAFRTTTATARVTLPPVVRAGPTVLKTFLETVTHTAAGVVTVTTQTATATETLPPVTNTATETDTATATKTVTATVTAPPVTHTQTQTATETQTQTQTATETQTQTETATETETQTETATETEPGPTETVTETFTCDPTPIIGDC